MSAPKQKSGTDSNVGPPCVCGHGLYEHYMCGTAESSACFHGDGCKRFMPGPGTKAYDAKVLASSRTGGQRT